MTFSLYSIIWDIGKEPTIKKKKGAKNFMIREKLKGEGFTLAELLIVVAIIAVLVAISIPVFTSQLEKSRESTDLANVRAAYAEIMVEANSQASGSSSNTYSRTVSLKQKENDWQTEGNITIGGITHVKDAGDTEHWKGIPGANGTCKVSYNATTGVVFEWNGGASTPGGDLPLTPAYYFTQMKTNYLDPNIDQIREYAEVHGGYTGFIIKKSDGTTNFISSIEDPSVGTGGWPSGAVASVITHDGTQYLFYNEDWSQQTTWSIGDDWGLD